MNDKAVSLLEQYDMEPIRTWKGRGAFLCETSRGLRIFKEYTGPVRKIGFLHAHLEHLKSQGDSMVEQIIPNKEGELLTYDTYKTPYVLKEYFPGSEINYKDLSACEKAVQRLAGIHLCSDIWFEEQKEMEGILPVYQVSKELERHNRELKKVKRYLKEKGTKSPFELYLSQHYDYFYDSALQVVEELQYYDTVKACSGDYVICHGDFQYHNILDSNGSLGIINFEKCVQDYGIRDLCLFMRKLLEKSNWSLQVGDRLFSAYDAVKPLTLGDRVQLRYRLAYPEKFRKIVNYYYNSGKAWIPGKNMEKLALLQEQEQQKQEFLAKILE
ncbi:MAG: CotS family spore coat protein [Lachnospiraceae bacterium]|nr:CotS family spore coat protein [Clostridiales bacterium]MDY3110002.1 CotS family spore coat protein [Lachnospiraceae bacterium]